VLAFAQNVFLGQDRQLGGCRCLASAVDSFAYVDATVVNGDCFDGECHVAKVEECCDPRTLIVAGTEKKKKITTR
jgi:hypothetical protein